MSQVCNSCNSQIVQDNEQHLCPTCKEQLYHCKICNAYMKEQDMPCFDSDKCFKCTEKEKQTNPSTEDEIYEWNDYGWVLCKKRRKCKKCKNYFLQGLHDDYDYNADNEKICVPCETKLFQKKYPEFEFAILNRFGKQIIHFRKMCVCGYYTKWYNATREDMDTGYRTVYQCSKCNPSTNMLTYEFIDHPLTFWYLQKEDRKCSLCNNIMRGDSRTIWGEIVQCEDHPPENTNGDIKYVFKNGWRAQRKVYQNKRYKWEYFKPGKFDANYKCTKGV
jgi:hypothetical protein